MRLKFKHKAPLLIIADDLTGTLDTVIKFSSRGAKAIALCAEGKERIASLFDEGYEVVAVNTASRHLSSTEARDRVYELVCGVLESHHVMVYKKTDSVLRGNIASEMEAVLKACGAAFIPFVPAYAQMGRTVKDGKMYVDGRLLGSTHFASDPFQKTSSSRLVDYFASSSLTTLDCAVPGYVPDGRNSADVVIYDGQSVEDLHECAFSLIERGVEAFSGCAGFAEALAQYLFGDEKHLGCQVPGPLAIVCGSVNPVSKAQLECIESLGIPRTRLAESQLTAPSFAASDLYEETVSTLVTALESGESIALDTLADSAFVSTSGLEAAGQVSSALAAVVTGVLEKGSFPLFIIGGDTLLAVLDALSAPLIEPLGEVEEGIALSLIKTGEMEIQIMSKSGGFGSVDLIARLLERNKGIQQEVIS